MSDPQKKRALILRSFKDEGTGESFEKDATPMIDAGAFGNYEAAGLVGTPPPAKKAAAKTAPKAARKPAAKPASAAKAPAAAVVKAPAGDSQQA